jgi:dipeptide transport system substrate-binding protein
VRTPTGQTLSTYINTQKKPMDDLRVRQAMSYAFDQEQAVAAANFQLKPANSIVPPSHWLHNANLPPHQYDLQKAKQLLTDAGYFANPVKLTYWYPPGEEFRRVVGEIMQAGLSQIGVQLDVQAQAFPIMSASRNNLDAAPHMVSLIDIQVDPDRYYGRFVTCASIGTTSFQRICDPEIDKMLADARSTTDRGVRLPIFQKLEQMLLDRAAIIPVTVQVDAQAMRDNVEGYAYTDAWILTWDVYHIHLK